MFVTPITVLDGVAADVTQTSDRISAKNFTLASVTGTIAGATSPTGTVQLWGSNEPPSSMLYYNSYDPSDASFGPIAGALATVTDNGGFTCSTGTISYLWLKVIWTPATGTGGTITAIIGGTRQGA